jgi:hypothetical protein
VIERIHGQGLSGDVNASRLPILNALGISQDIVPYADKDRNFPIAEGACWFDIPLVYSNRRRATLP